MLLITGSTGRSGKYFIQQLMENKYGHPIRCTTTGKSDTSFLDNCGLNITKVICDMNDPHSIDRAMDGIDEVVHIAPIPSSPAIIQAAITHKVNRVICVHTSGIYSRYKSASSIYLDIEAEIKRIIQRSNSSIQLIYLRPTMIYGDIDDYNIAVFISFLDKMRICPLINSGRNLIQPVNRRDLGKAYYQILSNKNITRGDYVLSGRDAVSMLDMMKLISNFLGKKTIFINLPLFIGIFVAECIKILTLKKTDFVEKVKRMGENRSFSHADATRDFGYSPMSFEEGLKAEVEQYILSKKQN